MPALYSLLSYLKVIPHAANGYDREIGSYASKFFAQKADVDFHMIFHCVGFQPPYAGEDLFFGEDLVARLKQQTHDLKLTGGQTDSCRVADQLSGGEFKPGIAVAQFVDLIALAAEQRVDTCQKLSRVKWS